MELKKAQEKLANTLRATNEAKLELADLVKTNKREVAKIEKLTREEELIVKSIASFKKQLKELGCLFETKSSEVGRLTDNETTLKNEIVKLEEEKLKKEEGDSKYLLEMEDKKTKSQEALDEQKRLFEENEEQFVNRIGELENEVSSKITQSEGLDKTIVEKKNEIETLDEDYKTKSDEIIILNNSIEPKEEAIEELKEEIENLDKELEEKKEQIVETEKQTEEAEEKKKKATEELEAEELKTSTLIERERTVKFKSKELEELYKKIGKTIKL